LPTLIESELFGYVEGAFTGVLHGKQGLLEAAHGGTLFLDEIGDMPVDLQAKLLRAWQEHRLSRCWSPRSLAMRLRETVRRLSQDWETRHHPVQQRAAQQGPVQPRTSLQSFVYSCAW
jgi:transcriptional regulator with GAF, ATPase, and Fis domain